MATKWQRLYAMKGQAAKQLKTICPDVNRESGIYVFKRIDENGIKFCYVGQAKNLEDRLTSHLIGYSQRIDISLKKRKLYDKEKNPNGWCIEIVSCSENELNDFEQRWIKHYIDEGWQMYNRTLGSQGVGKESINDGQSTKGYRDGLHQGYKNCLKEMRDLLAIVQLDSIYPQYYKKDGTLKEFAKKRYERLTDIAFGKDTD